MAQIAEVEVAKDGTVRVRRVVCAVDCGIVVNPATVRAQIESGFIFGITAALQGEITLKNGRVEQSNFDSYQMLSDWCRAHSLSSRPLACRETPVDWVLARNRKRFALESGRQSPHSPAVNPPRRAAVPLTCCCGTRNSKTQ